MALTRLNVNTALSATLPVSKGGTGVTTAADLANTGNRVLLNTTTVTTDTTNIDFDNTLITSTYGIYEIFIEYMSSASSSAVDTDINLSTDNGSSFISSIDQMSHRDRQDDQATGGNTFDLARKDQTDLQIFSGLEDDIPNVGAGLVTVFNAMDSNLHTIITHTTGNSVPGFTDNIRNHFGIARDDTAQAINFIRIKHSSGDIEKARVKLYGVK